jgi:flavin reductase (DIM6/NTAB) family NADH-FMN oxidoreductase RutF
MQETDAMAADVDNRHVFFEPAQVLTREGLAKLGLSHNPFTALVVPRPIGWISTVNSDGVANLAPFSFSNMVSQRPPMIMFCANADHSDGGDKDSLANARRTGEFVFNLATWDLRARMNDSSTMAPRGVDEFELVGLTKAPCVLVKPPRVASAPVSLECKVIRIVDLPKDEETGARNTATFGQVVGVHVHPSLIVNGLIDTTRAQPLARLGYLDYATLGPVFVMPRPPWPLAR